MRKRANRVEFKLNDTEYKHLNELVEISNLSRESYLRMLINGLVPKPSPSAELIEIIQILCQILDALLTNSQNNDNEFLIKIHDELQDQINSIMILIREPCEIKISFNNAYTKDSISKN